MFHRLFLLFLLCFSGLNADLIILKNGNEFRGRIVKKTKKTLEIEVAYGRINLQISEIKNIIPEEDTKTLLREGEEYLHYQSYPQAIEKFAQVLKKDSKSEEARNLFRRAAKEYGRLLLSNGNYSTAETFFKTIKSHFPEEDFADSFLASIEEGRKEITILFNKARSLASSNKWENAVQIYDQILAKAPGVLGKYSEEIAVANAKRAYQLPDSSFKKRLLHLEKALKLHPKISHKIENLYIQDRLRLVVADINANKFSTAKLKLLETLDFAPSSRQTRLYLGWVYESLGETSKARKQYGRILGFQASTRISTEELRVKAIEQIQGKQKETAKPSQAYWNEVDSKKFLAIETENFKIYAKNKRVAEEVAESAEHYLKKTYARLDPTNSVSIFKIKCDIYIYPNRDEYQKYVGKSHDWSGGITQHHVAGGVLKGHRIVAYQSASSLLRFILPHEVAHVLYRHILGYNYHPPLCLIEGVAMREEQTFQRENLKSTYRRAKKDGSFIPSEKLLTMRKYPAQKLVNIFYAESFMISDYLIEKFGIELFMKYCRETSTGSPIPLLKKIYGITPQELDAQMASFAGIR